MAVRKKQDDSPQLLGREQLLVKRKPKVVRLDLSEGFVYIREMYADEREQFENSVMKDKTSVHGPLPAFERDYSMFRAKLAVRTVCKEDGELIFTPEDIELLTKNMKAADLDAIVELAQRLSGISDQDREDLEKN